MDRKFFGFENQPGVEVIVRLSEVINQYLGKNANNLLKDQFFSCRTLSRKIFGMKKNEAAKKLHTYKNDKPIIIEKNDDENSLEIFKQKIRENFPNTESIRKKLNKLLLYSKLENLLIELMVPIDNRLEINQINQKDVIKHFMKIFIMKFYEEQLDILNNFLLRRENYKFYGNIFRVHFFEKEYNRAKEAKCMANYEIISKKNILLK